MKRSREAQNLKESHGNTSLPKKHAGLNGAGLKIMLPVFASIIPALILGGAVLWIVLKHRVKDLYSTQNAFFPNPSKTVDASVYWVNFDVNRLLTVSSWASNVAILFPGFIMTLFWYYIAVSFR